jgi:hypothetical protein
MTTRRVADLVLGLTLALVLAGSVALAQVLLPATMNRTCVECIPAQYAGDPASVPKDPYLWTMTSTGWNNGEEVTPCYEFASGLVLGWYGT